MKRLLPACLLMALAAPVEPQVVPRPAQRTGPPGDTVLLSLTLAPPAMRFSESSDLAALLAGEAEAGFAANPAALGAPSGLSLASQYASRMPMLNLPSLHDFSQSFAYTGPGGSWAHLGAGVGIRSMGLGPGQRAMEYSLAAGRRLDASGKVTQDLGMTLKAVTTEGFRAPDGTTPDLGLLADIGYLVTLGGYLRAGAVLENLGKGAAGVRPVLTDVASNGSRSISLSTVADPGFSLTPPTFTLGAALSHSWDAHSLRILDASLAGTWAKRPFDGPGDQSFTSVVLGVGLLRTLGAQGGFQRDPSNAEIQGKLGLSLFFLNHFRLAFAYLGATGGRELYDGQRGFSLTLTDLLDWKRGDLAWWRLSHDADTRPAGPGP